MSSSNYSVYLTNKKCKKNISSDFVCKTGDTMTGDLNMNCNDVLNITKLSFCDNGVVCGDVEFIDDLQVDGSVVSLGSALFNDLSVNNVYIYSGLNLNCNEIYDVSGINFCDGTYIGQGNSFDICTNEVLHITSSQYTIIDGDLSANNNVIINGDLTVNGIIKGKNELRLHEPFIFQESKYDISLINGFGPGETWSGGVLANNGNIYGIPYDSSAVLIIDPEENTVNMDISVPNLTDKWKGGALANNGKIYTIPYDSSYVLVIDPETNTTYDLSISPIIANTQDKWYGGVLAPNKKIYSVPFDASGILIINTELDTTSIITGIGLAGANKWSGGVLAPNGKIYTMPYDSSFVLVIEPETDTTYTLNLPSGVDVSLNKWSGGVLAQNGNIYGIPHGSNQILRIDTETDFIDVSLDISGVITPPDKIIFNGGVLSNDGKIYCLPYDISGSTSGILIIDPETETVSLGSKTLTSANDLYSGGVLSPNGKIYGIPDNSDNVMIIRPGLPILPNWMMSAYFNKF